MFSIRTNTKPSKLTPSLTAGFTPGVRFPASLSRSRNGNLLFVVRNDTVECCDHCGRFFLANLQLNSKEIFQ